MLSWLYLDYADQAGYRHIILGGHSLGANKVIYYLSRHHDPRVEHFILFSPANLTHMMSGVTDYERELIRQQVERGDGNKLLPFYFMGWVRCIANTAYDWAFTDMLNNVHLERDADFTQVSQITHTGALMIGTYDRFTYGDPAGFLKNITDPMMGLTYEMEPIYDKLKQEYGDQIEFRWVMSLLVKDVSDFMTPRERAMDPEEGIRAYNARLAQIYKSEKAIGGLPINMEGFCVVVHRGDEFPYPCTALRQRH